MGFTGSHLREAMLSICEYVVFFHVANDMADDEIKDLYTLYDMFNHLAWDRHPRHWSVGSVELWRNNLS